MNVEIFREEQSGFGLEETIGYITSFQGEEKGCVWLKHERGGELAVMVCGELAAVHFFTGEEGHPGFQTVIKEEFAEDEATVDFKADNGELLELQKMSVVRVEDAARFVRGFWAEGLLPFPEEWEDLAGQIPAPSEGEKGWWRFW